MAGHTLVTIARRGGGGFSSVLLDQTGAPASNQIAIDPATLAMPEGPYVVTTTLTPADGTPATTMNRNLVVDGTLGGLKVSAKTAGKGKAKTNTVKTSFTLSRQAKVTMKIINSSGKTVATGASNRKMAGGKRTVTWNGKALPAGSYNVVLTAQSSYGLSGLQDSIRLK